MKIKRSAFYVTMYGLIQPVTMGLAIAFATFSSCKWIGSISVNLRALFWMRIRDIAAAKYTRFFHTTLPRSTYTEGSNENTNYEHFEIIHESDLRVCVQFILQRTNLLD